LASRGERGTDAILYFGGLLALAVLDGQNIKTGPAVGDRAPDFSAQDQEGRRQTLKSVSGLKGTMLVSFRSAGW
jgi:hypothetical protein